MVVVAAGGAAAAPCIDCGWARPACWDSGAGPIDTRGCSNAMTDHDDLSRVIRTTAAAPGQYQLDVPTGWGQARGTFGGLLLGAAVHAVRQSEVDGERQLRSITAEIAGPVMPGPATIETREVRRGSAVSTWSTSLVSGDDTLVVANLVLGRDRQIDRVWQPEAPRALPWADCPAVPTGPPFAPEFTQFFEIRPIGALPFSGATEATALGWVRPRRASAGIGCAELVAIADAWWPAAYAVERAPRPIATISFFAQCFLGDRTLPADVPLLHRARSVAGAGGYFVEFRELWTPQGELVLLNQQTFVFIR